MILRVLKWIAGIALAVVLVAAGTLYAMFGAGKPYPDLSGTPILPEGTIEAAVTTDIPMGNAVVNADGRIFFTVHPESNPEGPRLFEWVDGKAKPFPDEKTQKDLFQTPLGLKIDPINRLWIIDPANHGMGQPRLIAIDLDIDEVAHTHNFSRDVAPRGSFLQDLQVSADGRFVFIADVGFWTKRPGLVVYDSDTGTERRFLDRHASVYPQNILIRNQIRPMSFVGGLLEMKTGIDGLALSRDGKWLNYAAMNHDTLYRVPVSVLTDPNSDEAKVEASIEVVGKKPLNDGMASDDAGNVFITDVEHQAVMMMKPDGKLETLVKDSRIRWADGLAFGPDGWLYLADSAIPELVLQGPDHIRSVAPFHIWRFKPGTTAAAGQ